MRPLFEPFYQRSDWLPGLFPPHWLPPMSSLAPWLLNHSGSSLGHKKLARRRFIPLYPINILAGNITEVSVVVQVLPPVWVAWDEVLSVERYWQPLAWCGELSLEHQLPKRLVPRLYSSAVVRPALREGELAAGRSMSCRALQRHLLGCNWRRLLFPGQSLNSSWLASFWMNSINGLMQRDATEGGLS